jgi:S-adenosylmethionine:tRNA ribosyltransferase-isomerase
MSDSVEAFDYDLPPERIAQRPVEPRDSSRLLHLTPSGEIDDHVFTDLPGLLRSGDLLVVNDTRVRAARLLGTRDGGGRAEVLLLRRLDGAAENAASARFAGLVRPARRLRPGTVVEVGEGLLAQIGEPMAGHPGARCVTVTAQGSVDAAIERAGTVPLPPYIRKSLDDPTRYQTLFSAASPPESAAAPTAGLHFTPAVLDALRDRGVELARVRLDVGLGTFSPIRTALVEDHRMHAERFELPAATASAIAAARERGGRVVAVGTTAVRTLESRARNDGLVEPGAGTTELFLRPGTPPRVIDGLLTNFHQPRSSLLVLLAAVVGDRWRDAYEHALRSGYRFLSFGDCMLCWR